MIEESKFHLKEKVVKQAASTAIAATTLNTSNSPALNGGDLSKQSKLAFA